MPSSDVTLTQDEIRAAAGRITLCLESIEGGRHESLSPSEVLTILSFVASAVVVVGAHERDIDPCGPCEAFIKAFREQVKVMASGETETVAVH